MNSVRQLVTLGVVSASMSLPLSRPTPIAKYRLPPRPDSTSAGCRTAASSSAAVVGIAWGRRNPSDPFDHFCRGFALITLATGTRQKVVTLPESERGTWAVDEPTLVRKSIAYLQYPFKVPGSSWRIKLLDLTTGRTRTLDYWHGKGIIDVGPAITRSGDTLVWISGVHGPHSAALYQIHTYSLATGRSSTIATSKAGVRFEDAYMSGSVVCFLAQTKTGTDVWVLNIRTRHLRRLTRSGHASEAVITGPWVAWHVSGKNAVGAVMVDDLRTGKIRVITKQPSYSLSAGNGLLTFDNYYAQKSEIADLATGDLWRPPTIASSQINGTNALIEGNVIVESASTPGGMEGGLQIVAVYASRPLPRPPSF